MELKDTVKLMLSEDYKERFVAEYWQTKIRYEKLHKLLVKHDAGKLEFAPNSPISLLIEQARKMGEYLYALEVRAVAEGINLEEYVDLIWLGEQNG